MEDSAKIRKIKLLEDRAVRLRKQLERQEADFFLLQSSETRRYEVKKGDSLWRIAKRNDTYNNPYMWIKIYNANMAKIDDPNMIYPGQLFEMPN